MNKKTELNFLIILSILYFIFFPINISTTETPYWLYIIFSYLFYMIFWIIPIILTYKINKKKIYIAILIINIILLPIFWYFADNNATNNQKIINDKILRITNF